MLNNGHILTAAQMLAAEQVLVDDGVSVDELMQRAGQRAAQNIWRVSASMPTTVLCGPGNNGGDGYVIARWLKDKGIDVTVAASAEPKSGAAKKASSLWRGTTVPIEKAKPLPQFVDCLFGTGLSRPIEQALFKQYQRLCNGSKRRIAIDLPSGVATDTGELLNDIPVFDFTLALGAFKPSHYLLPSKTVMGKLIGVDIGIETPSQFQLLNKPDIKKPKNDAHKYSRGLVGIVAGEMQGAAILSAMAAQRSGAGYVKIFSQKSVLAPNSSIVAEQFSDDEQLSELLSDTRISALLIGPGLGRGEDAQALLDKVLASKKPLVLDADALVLMGHDFARTVNARKNETVATPHGGEFDKISKKAKSYKLDAVRDLASSSGATILLKGSDTIIADAAGNTRIAASASNWLSTAGSGDVLAGIIASRLANGSNAFEASNQGQWLHMQAARIAGPALVPEDLIDQIRQALEQCL